MSTYERVARIIAENRGIEADTITPETTFEQLSFDSLDTVELVMNFEEEFDLSIEAPEEGLKTVQEAVDLIDSLL